MNTFTCSAEVCCGPAIYMNIYAKYKYIILYINNKDNFGTGIGDSDIVCQVCIVYDNSYTAHCIYSYTQAIIIRLYQVKVWQRVSWRQLMPLRCRSLRFES